MSVLVEKGSFAARTTAGSQTVSLAAAAGFACKAIILWCGSLTADGTSSNGALAVGFGTNDGGSAQNAVTSVTQLDGQTTTRETRTLSVSEILRNQTPTSGGTVTTDYLATLTSIADAAFTLNWTTAPASAYVVHYLALGGSDLVGAMCGSFACTTTAGANIDTTVATGWGQPEVVFCAAQAYGTSESVAGTGYWQLGAGNAALEQRNLCLVDDTADTGTNLSYMQSNHLLETSTSGPGFSRDFVLDLASLANWPADGFRVTQTQAGGGTTRVIWLALKGTFLSDIGSITVPTVGTAPISQDVSLPFAPQGALLWGANMADSDTLVQTDSSMGMAWVAGTDGTNQGYAGWSDSDGQTTSNTDRYHKTGKGVELYTPGVFSGSHVAPTLNSAADLSFVGSALRLTWTTGPDSVARVFSYVAFGSPTPPQTVLPDADITTTGWTTTPLFSKVNDASDSTFITATLS